MMERHTITKTAARLFGATLFLAGCGGASPWVPPAVSAASATELTLVWVGRGECERWEDGAWVRRPEFDYDFSVEQRRSGDHWSSVKSLRRRHPGYDGSAGERLQTYFFELTLGSVGEGGRADDVALSMASSLGLGSGTSDRSFRRAALEIVADVSSMAPFDRYRITQEYDYEAGQLRELVELNDGETPWVRNREVAMLFAPRTFDAPPTER